LDFYEGDFQRTSFNVDGFVLPVTTYIQNHLNLLQYPLQLAVDELFIKTVSNCVHVNKSQLNVSERIKCTIIPDYEVQQGENRDAINCYNDRVIANTFFPNMEFRIAVHQYREFFTVIYWILCKVLPIDRIHLYHLHKYSYYRLLIGECYISNVPGVYSYCKTPVFLKAWYQMELGGELYLSTNRDEFLEFHKIYKFGEVYLDLLKDMRCNVDYQQLKNKIIGFDRKIFTLAFPRVQMFPIFDTIVFRLMRLLKTNIDEEYTFSCDPLTDLRVYPKHEIEGPTFRLDVGEKVRVLICRDSYFGIKATSVQHAKMAKGKTSNIMKVRYNVQNTMFKIFDVMLRANIGVPTLEEFKDYFYLCTSIRRNNSSTVYYIYPINILEQIEKFYNIYVEYVHRRIIC
jgi:hypothetical protein